MSAFLPEPPFRHDRPARIGIVLINLGTPQAPTAAALRRYLREFLADRRVVELPRLVWWPILHGIVLNTRPKKSAQKYASIWQPEGSPLQVHTERLTARLREALAAHIAEPIQIEYAMRYGQPAVAEVIERMRAQGCDRLLILPLYPQYAASSTGSALDAVWRHLLGVRNVPELRSVRHFHDDPGYIAALKQSVERHWAEHGRGDLLLMSFHGVPRAALEQGDPYHCECHKTGRLLAEALSLAPDEYRVSFQSRFGRGEWLKPYTAEILAELGQKKLRRLDVLCPGFTADCLETLEEIAIEGKAIFLNAGGGEYRYIPALNSHPAWVTALADLCQRHLQGWLNPAWSAEAEAAELAARKERAAALQAAAP